MQENKKKPNGVFHLFCTGMLVPAALLIGLGYLDCTQPALAISLLVLGVSLTGIQYSGWIVNHMDIAPMFAGILFGIANSVAAVTGFLSPVIVGVVTEVCSKFLIVVPFVERTLCSAPASHLSISHAVCLSGPKFRNLFIRSIMR